MTQGGWRVAQAGPVPRAVTPARALAHREPSLGAVPAGLVLVQQDTP